MFHASHFMFHGRRRGFTLIEMLVALALFVTTVSIAVTGFVSALRTQRQVASLIAANNNLSLTLEQMAREIRTGYSFCRSVFPCALPDELNFVNAASQPVTYRLAGNAIVREVANSFGGPVTTETITSDNVSVRYLAFTLRGNLSGDGWPPRITIAVGVSSNDPVFKDAIINLQTTISARQIDT